MEKASQTPSTKTCGKNCCLSVAPFIVGLVVALIFGWWIFPELMFSQKNQPVQFSHKSHDMIECQECHYIRDDGSFSGIPTLESCTSCHADLDSLQGDSEAERYFVAEYVLKEKEVPWLVYQKQPDNVFFSHAAHSIENCAKSGCHDYSPMNPDRIRKTDDSGDISLCATCHYDMTQEENMPVYRENIISGYSSTTMKMADCESCHAIAAHSRGKAQASNACSVCHK